MTLFYPCIDLHNGQVKQIVGGSLRDDGSEPQCNFVSEHDSQWYAQLYRNDNARNGHIIKLGPNNDQAAEQALNAWPQGMHLGGGITDDNAQAWLDKGAEKIIVTSWLFNGPDFLFSRLKELSALVGRERLVVDLSCRSTHNNTWHVATQRWQCISDLEINAENLQRISDYCSEFLIHAADVEGLCQGIDLKLVEFLGQHCPISCTYAGGANSLDDLQQVESLSNGSVHLTFGSALDIFGGSTVSYKDCIAWNATHISAQP